MLLLGTLLFSTLTVSAQQLRGKVKDEASNEFLIGATVTVTGASATVSDITELDGSFLFKKLPAGTYRLSVSYVGYDAYTKNVQVSASGENRINIALNNGTQSLNEVVIMAAGSRESDESARKSELRAANILNVVSAKTIEVSPDITIGNVLQRVSGVSRVVANIPGKCFIKHSQYLNNQIFVRLLVLCLL